MDLLDYDELTDLSRASVTQKVFSKSADRVSVIDRSARTSARIEVPWNDPNMRHATVTDIASARR